MKKYTIATYILFITVFALDLNAATIRLVGLGNYFQSGTGDVPKVSITNDKNQIGIPVAPLGIQGSLTRINNLTLPVYINVKYSDRPAYQIAIEEETDNAQKLPCSGATSTTVKATVSPGQGNIQKVCVPLSTSNIPTRITNIKSGDFNNIAFLLGPLVAQQAANYDAKNPNSLPFSFGLMAWTSLNDIWQNVKLRQTPDAQGIKFTQPARVYQGFAALGGGPIPRSYFGSIAHIYNDTDNILLLSRVANESALAPFNFTQVIPPHSIFPYALVWIPKVSDESKLALPRYSSLRIATFVKRDTARAVDPSATQTEAGDADLDDTDAPPTDVFADWDKEFDKISLSVTPAAGDLLGITDWSRNIKTSYKDFIASNHFYSIVTTADKQATFIQRCPWGSKPCQTINTLVVPLAYNLKSGIPTFYSLVVKQDAVKKNKLLFNLYPITLESPTPAQ